MTRCGWAKGDLMAEYHDTEWGVPLHEDQKLFEYIVLDGAQAGLSWSTILNKREGYRALFANFDPVKVARFDAKRIERILTDARIVRNRLKVESAVKNAKAFLRVQKEFKTFDAYIWQFTDSKTLVNTWETMKDIPARSVESDAMSKDMRQRGFNFVGSTICYAFMQAAGMVNDHTLDCFRYREVQGKR